MQSLFHISESTWAQGAELSSALPSHKQVADLEVEQAGHKLASIWKAGLIDVDFHYSNGYLSTFVLICSSCMNGEFF